ncbi:MAG: hypothetical protein H0X63_07765 [Flavobacteriales bacterium]|nr:hypothetical protein [Flavobacteriales bacterium]
MVNKNDSKKHIARQDHLLKEAVLNIKVRNENPYAQVSTFTIPSKTHHANQKL